MQQVARQIGPPREDLALLLGTAGLFGILASVMYLTRDLDWYAPDLGAAHG